ncbi:CBS domain-containing protein [Halorussus caseinilyticus]|uniref:CBS domain-containing protein n=1 Tax=Halorussus caseinilyticus TaxID=3034025 RepID=A0ABD5WG06_9EURY|nr:CBS domain-containing protein [Halorussus sp. DT72]
MKVGLQSIYSEHVVTASPDTPVEEVARTMFGESVGSVVAESGDLRGIVTDRDLTVELLAEDSEYNVSSGEDDLIVHLAGEHQRLAADTRAIADVIEEESPR